MFKVHWQKIGINQSWQGRFRGKADLHFHSRYSDGSKAVDFRTMCQIAKFYGAGAVALTDHDTIAGLGEFLAAAREYSLPIITGVEVSTSHRGGPEIHTLAYGFDPENKELQTALKNIQQQLVERFRNLARWANDQLGKNAVTDEEVNQIIRAESGGTFGRPHLAKLLLEKGLFPLKEKASDRAGAPAFRFLKPATDLFPAPTLDLNAAIELIHSASGLAFMAHPLGNERSPKEIAKRPKDFINSLLENYAYDGIEVVHSEHSWKDILYLKDLAKRRGLLVSGGSDTHWKEGDTRIFGISPRKALTLQPWMKERLIT